VCFCVLLPGAALVAAVAGVGMKSEHQADALKAAVGVVEAIKKVHPNSKLGEVLGPERINAVAKAVSTVRVGATVAVGVCVSSRLQEYGVGGRGCSCVGVPHLILLKYWVELALQGSKALLPVRCAATRSALHCLSLTVAKMNCFL